MRSNDIQTRRDELRAKMQQAIKAGDVDGFFASFDDMQYEIERDIKEQYQEALYLLYFEGLTLDEAARVLGKNKKQVENLSYRGKQALKQDLGKEARR